MITGMIGFKKAQSQTFAEDGRRIPITEVNAGPCTVIQLKQADRDGYSSVQLGFGIQKTKNITRPRLGHIKKAGLGEQNLPRFLREIRLHELTDDSILKVGLTLTVSDVFKPGETVQITGISKGKGFAGVVKRHHFRGGPRTHGQSDRERAPGAIGQTTTPGRVYKGKRMAGHMGRKRATITNLPIIAVNSEKNTLMVKGLIPGPIGGLVKIMKKTK